MLKFDHLTLAVSDWQASRRWYVEVLGLTVEFEMPDRRSVAVRDEHDFTVFLAEGPVPEHPEAFALYFQVDDVHAAYPAMAAKGARDGHPPQKAFWGFGAELRDPDGYLVRLWDEKSMNS
jgi:catechol 2,3-dioxygenase-like lactoylglutathione lyase family enzyme